MAVLRLTSKKTFPLILAALAKHSFSQTGLAEDEGISVGRVNRIVTWMREKELVVKEGGKYVITRPNRLVELVAAQQVLVATRTYYVQGDATSVLKSLGVKATRCLRSALEAHDEGSSSDSLALVATDEVRAALEAMSRGECRVELIGYDDVPGGSETGPERTVVDLHSVGEGQLAERLALRLWGTHQ